jgi:hypothetical protein
LHASSFFGLGDIFKSEMGGFVALVAHRALPFISYALLIGRSRGVTMHLPV